MPLTTPAINCWKNLCASFSGIPTSGSVTVNKWHFKNLSYFELAISTSIQTPSDEHEIIQWHKTNKITLPIKSFYITHRFGRRAPLHYNTLGRYTVLYLHSCAQRNVLYWGVTASCICTPLSSHCLCSLWLWPYLQLSLLQPPQSSCSPAVEP